jgi:hypothetical protein
LAWVISLAQSPGDQRDPGRSAEVSVEVRADLVSVQPGGADLAHGGDDLGGGQQADVGGADWMLRRLVLHPFAGRQRVDAAEEEGHRRAVLGSQRAEPWEQPDLQVGRAVPGEHDELGRRLSRFRSIGFGLMRLGPGSAVDPSPMRRLTAAPPGVLAGAPGVRAVAKELQAAIPSTDADAHPRNALRDNRIPGFARMPSPWNSHRPDFASGRPICGPIPRTGVTLGNSRGDGRLI